MANTSVIFKGEYAKLLAKTGIEFKDETRILPYGGNPNTVVDAPKGSLVLDKTNGRIYQNTDGSTAWTEIGQETAQQRINLTSAESPYTVTGNFHNTIYAVDLTGGDVIVNLPAVSAENEGKCLFIYIEINPGNVNKLIINTNGTDTIRGQTSVEMNVLRDGFKLVAHTYLINHWDALSWERTDEIVYQPGNEGVTSINTLQGLLDYSLSSTEISGGSITNNGNGTISVAASEWKLRTTDSPGADCRVYSIPASINLEPTNNATSYLVVAYNSGAPQYTIETDITTISCRDKCVKAILFRWGTQIDILEIGRYSVDHNALYARKQSVTDWLEYGSGLQPSFTNLQFSFTSGSLYSGVIRHEVATLSSATDSFEYWYRDGSGGWTVTAGNTDINNTNYDDGTGTLAVLLNTQKYGVHWIYVSVDNPSRLLVVFGQDEYDSLSDARSAQVPSVLPPFAQKYSTGKLVGKAIVQKSATVLTDIETPFDTVFTSASPVSHNDLAGLQGGIIDEYYHLTQAQHTIATQAATSSLAGYVTNTDQEFGGRKTLDRPRFKSAGGTPTTLIGSSTGNSNVCVAGFYESNGTVLQGYVGMGSSSSQEVFLASSNSNVVLQAAVGAFVVAPQVYNQTTAASANVVSLSNNTIIRSTSSIKYKTNVEDLWASTAEAFLSKARPIWYDSLCENDNKDWHHLGFIAEELDEAGFPQLVHYAQKEDGTLEPEGVQYERVTVLLTKLAQEAKAERDTLKAQNEWLKADLYSVKKQIELLRKELGLKPLFTEKSLFRRAIETIKGKGK